MVVAATVKLEFIHVSHSFLSQSKCIADLSIMNSTIFHNGEKKLSQNWLTIVNSTSIILLSTIIGE